MEKEQKTQGKLSTESYKGVRDFYPEDKFIQDYIFSIWKKTAESFGYISYDASILEPTELYKAKSGEEIINEQTYSFIDRGERDVTLRPEMTPTVARMIAGKRREFKFPVRWYSIPNLFRYERPQRGRLREHWQLNCDIFGVAGIEAEVEMISMAYKIMRNFGISDDKFEVRINYSGMLAEVIALTAQLNPTQTREVVRLMDKKRGKVSDDEFNKLMDGVVGVENRTKIFSMFGDADIQKEFAKHYGFQQCVLLRDSLKKIGIEITLDTFLTRGFDYYTGIVFEIRDRNPENPRALFGGGRYDNLLSIFGEEPVPTVGFGMGDVTIRDVLETYDLLPLYISPTKVAVLPFDENSFDAANNIAQSLRSKYINTVVDYSNKKIGDKINKADKEKIKYVLVVGEDEIKSKIYKLKELATKKEFEGYIDHVADFILNS